MKRDAMKLDVLAIGAHPDDVELGCGGTVAKLAKKGKKVGIVHLTRGERGTRGTLEDRLKEAEKAAEELGATSLDFLDCGDGALRTGEAEEDALMELLRRYRPRLILGPAPSDRHPDHGRSHRLVEAAAFYSGLRNRGSGEPHRPAAVFSYMQHDPFEPRFIVDVSAVWDRKLAALAAHSSQLYQPGQPDPEGEAVVAGQPVTKVSTPEFSLAMEGRARHFGLLIGAAYGEPFWSRLPLAVGDPLDVIPGGVL
ncbi:MAG: bacillithiol biosynthesis deacetylase BshB1 [Deltaproteobacteria bacterium]|nr:bacillithiol biosynthesis deacetylase BshB1 [Deltaproteobacteria bacterium]